MATTMVVTGVDRREDVGWDVTKDTAVSPRQERQWWQRFVMSSKKRITTRVRYNNNNNNAPEKRRRLRRVYVHDTCGDTLTRRSCFFAYRFYDISNLVQRIQYYKRNFSRISTTVTIDEIAHVTLPCTPLLFFFFLNQKQESGDYILYIRLVIYWTERLETRLQTLYKYDNNT